MRRLLFGAIVAAISLVGLPGSAFAATGSEAISVRTFSQGGQTIRYVEAEGPITGSGTETVLTTAIFPRGAREVTVEWDFGQGAVFATMKIQQTVVAAGPPTCITVVQFTGTFEITGGTGAYEGASGSGTLTGEGRVFLTFNPSTGRCAGPPTSMAADRYMTGTVTVASTSSDEPDAAEAA